MVVSVRKKNAPAGRGRKKTAILQAKADWLDIAARMVLGLFFAFSAGRYFINAYAGLRPLNDAHGYVVQAINAFSVLAMGFFTFFIAYLYLVRLPRVNKFAGWLPAMAAILGSFFAFGLLLFRQRLDMPVELKLVSCLLILGGNSFALYCLSYLGRSFSILPEGRALVTAGPYRYIRHPLYLAEFFSTFGALLNFASPWAAAVVGAQFVLQFARMYYEEKVLRETFPAYDAYSRRTARLIPGIY